MADGLLHIIDFKYGVGILVSAAGEDGTGNSQLKCYALGAVDTFGDLYDIGRIRLSIYQPRRGNVDTYELTKDGLLAWAEDVLAPTAKLAYEGKGEFAAGDHCQFCKVKATCRKRAEYAMELAKYDFAEAPTLETDEIQSIIDRTVTEQIPTDAAIELFFEDDQYIYSFPSVKSQYVIVTFTDGVQMPVKEALEKGTITLRALTVYGIEYIAKKK